jgi:hypothetical protein
MRIKHYSMFNVHSTKVINWNGLRDEELELPYCLPNSRDKYLLKVNAEQVSVTVLTMIEQIQKLGYTKMLSLGSGIAQTEYHIKENSNLEVIVSDNTNSIKRLKTYNIFHDALSIDIVKDDFPADENTLVLLHRIDTEFDDRDLKLIFDKLKKTGVKHICFVPTNPFAFKILLSEFKTFVLSIIKLKKRTFCGYCRSKSTLVKIWDNSYSLIYEYKQKRPFYFLELNAKTKIK